MTMFGIGIDICEVRRFDRLKEKEGFLRKIFSEDEISYCISKKNSSECFAVRFAAKEAFLKALGTGLRSGVHLKEIAVANGELGKPDIILSGETAATFGKMGLSKILLSMSHEKQNAVAVVMIDY
jgi:holo-[acyl-carrier protein] synthase